MIRALEGLTVLALEQATTLPFLTYRLACDGARVIRVENPQRPDPNRFVGRDVLGEPAMRGYFLPNNCGKEAITLNLATPEGRALLHDLVRRLPVDIIATNQRPRAYASLGIDEPTLRAVRRDLIWLGISGFGPAHDEPAYDPVLQARAGFMALTGEPDGPPTLPPFGLADGIAALATSFAITAALRSAEATGHGQVVDVAIIEPILMLLGPQITTFDQLGEVQQRLGNRSVNNAPRNVYRTADGEWVAVSTSSQSIAERVMRLVGRADLIERPWFATGQQRAQHADELDAAVGGWISTRSSAEVLAAF
jgi:crotonobetainyl-CoA:carnitine CoA-transferase CaiB-like acyl-CoA transferase